MKPSVAYKRMAAFEAYDAKTKAAAAERKSKLPDVDDAKMAQLGEKLGGSDGIATFISAMPGTPSANAIIEQYTADELSLLIKTTMGGNLAALAALAESGCARDAKKLKALTDHFKGKEAVLGNMITEGGLGDHPEALAAMYGTGCAGSPADFETLCNKFNDEPKRKKLGKALNEGGLGACPHALGPLAADDNGALLLKFTTDIPEADLPTLNALVTKGGLGGQPPSNPHTLVSVVKDGLGGEPKDLKHLHTAFGAGGMQDLSTMLNALNGSSDGTGAAAGVQMKKLTDAFARRNSALTTPAQRLAKLKSPYFDTIKDSTTGSKVAPEIASTAVTAAQALMTQAPGPATTVATLSTSLPVGLAGDIVAGALTTQTDRDQLSAALGQLDQADAMTTRIKADTATRPADAEATARTKSAVKAADDLRVALDAKLDGGTVAEVAALSAAAELCFAMADAEPDPTERGLAVAAGEAGANAAKAALRRQSAKVLAAGSAHDDQAAALTTITGATGQVAADPKATPTRKAAMQDLSQAGMKSLSVSLLAEGGNDPDAAARISLDAMTSTAAGDAGALAAAKLAATKRAQDAQHAADAVSAELDSAPKPLDAKLVKRAAEASEAAVKAGLACSEAGQLTASVAAGKDLAAKVATLLTQISGAIRTEYALAKPEAGAGVLAANDAGAAIAALDQTAGGSAGQKAGLDDMVKAAQQAGLAMGETAAFEAMDAGAQTDAAKATAAAAAAHAGQTLDAATLAANSAASTAGLAAKNAADQLDGKTVPPPTPPTLPTLIDKTLIETASAAAEAALKAAKNAVDPVVRTEVIAQAKLAGAQVARAVAENAKALMQHASAVAATTAQTAVANQRASQDTVVAAYTSNNPALSATDLGAARTAIDTARGSVEKAAAASLAETAAADAGVKAARIEAAQKAAKAATPGAGYLPTLQSLLADTQVQRKLAEAMFTKAKSNVDGMIKVTVTDLSTISRPADPAPPPPPPAFVQAVPKPTAPTPAELRDANTQCQAAATALIRWSEAADRLKEAAINYQRLIDAVPSKSSDETAEQTKITAIATTKAPAEVTDCAAKQKALGVVMANLVEKAEALMAESMQARLGLPTGWTAGPGDLAANGPGNVADTDLENAVGFVSLMSDTSFKQKGGGESAPPITMDALIALGATLEKKPTGVNNAHALDGTDTAQFDHALARHCREHQTMGGDELRSETECLIGKLVSARSAGNTRAAGQKRDIISDTENRAKKPAHGDDMTSLWPDGVDKGKLETAMKACLVDLRASLGGGHGLEADAYAVAAGHKKDYDRTITIDTHTIKIRIVVKAASATGPAQVITFFPLDTDVVTFKDMHVAKKALGL